MILYLDTSAMVSLFINEGRTVEVQQLVFGGSSETGMSDLTQGEFSAAIWTNVRIERLTVEQARFALDGADVWIRAGTTRIELDRADFRAAAALVRRFELGLLFPDAIHFALCERSGSTLVTGDKRQADAADMLGIPLIRV